MESLDRGRDSHAINGTDRDTLYLLGGLAMMVFGAGLILSSPATRRLVGQVGLPDLTQLALPDIERYMKIRSM
jgi:hypothetical protein